MAPTMIKLTRGVLIDGRHRDPSEPPFAVDSKLAASLISCGKAMSPGIPDPSPVPSGDPVPIHGDPKPGAGWPAGVAPRATPKKK